MRTVYKFLAGREETTWEDPELDERIILKWIWEIQCVEWIKLAHDMVQ
jgi:hypothetical protein